MVKGRGRCRDNNRGRGRGRVTYPPSPRTGSINIAHVSSGLDCCFNSCCICSKAYGTFSVRVRGRVGVGVRVRVAVGVRARVTVRVRLLLLELLLPESVAFALRKA
jgi:hypothetical protein